MASNKKKKKPAANPARGFATMSIASKPRADPAEGAELTGSMTPASGHIPTTEDRARGPKAADQNTSDDSVVINAMNSTIQVAAPPLSPDDFEKQLEESELQLLVDKYAQKVRRDAQRQWTRLETDRRLLRGQAEGINTRKWFTQDLVDDILNLIQAESRFAASSAASEFALSNRKLLPEEDLTIKLWTLKQTLNLAAFPEDKVQSVLKHIVDISTQVGSPVKDSIWGLEEASEWLARESAVEELPNYNKRGKPQNDTPAETPIASGATTLHHFEFKSSQKDKKPISTRQCSSKQSIITYNDEIEPEELIPVFIDTKSRLFALQRPLQEAPDSKLQGSAKAPTLTPVEDKANRVQIATLLRKLDYIENDILFDKRLAEMQWRTKKIALEREYSEARKRAAEKLRARAKEDASVAAHLTTTTTSESGASDTDTGSSSGDVNAEAERIAVEILAEDDSGYGGLAELFSSLPVNEADPKTGKTNMVVNNADGSKLVIRDFGKWSGVSPVRVLEEACRARDTSARVFYKAVSEASFANQHLVVVNWAKPQEVPLFPSISDVETAARPTQFVFKMVGIATPKPKQSEEFIATAALFLIFGSSVKEEKVYMRLPATWRDLWNEFAEEKKSQADALDRTTVKTLRNLVRQRRDQELEDGVVLQGAFRGRNTGKNVIDSSEDSGFDRARHSNSPEFYQRIWKDKSSTPRFQSMLQARMQLPMWGFREQILNAVDREQVVIICGETGCGKSTQVPSFLLERQLAQGKPCKIYCTEPRRISAISLARRVSEELGEGRNDLGTPRSLVGFSIRLEANTSKETRLIYATTGTVMRMLEASNDLRDITHLVLDEVHERSIESDFLLIVLKRLLKRRKDLKVVLMSATVDAGRFSEYLGGAPVLNVPGRTFPVRVKYLEDAVELTGYSHDQRAAEKFVDLDDDILDDVAIETSSKPDLLKTLKAYSSRTRNTLSQMDEYQIPFDLIVQLISVIAKEPSYSQYSKAILVFLPGIAEIRTMNDLLLGDKNIYTNWQVFPLHSTIATEDQEAVFSVPPAGMRKIVLATNIAETGITIPDVTCVIDTGKHREMHFDERRQLSRLIDTFISRANAKQRRGRAGRVQEGLCFHLFTKYRHDQIMGDQQTPEMLRLSLQDLAIRVKICKIGAVEDTLSQALDPPSAKNIRRAIDALIDVRALTSGEDLTPLGLQLARLPLDVFLGKLVLLGTIFKCLDMAVTVAAILSSKTPFSAPFHQRAQANTVRMGFRRGDSDVLTIYNAYLAWKRVCQSAAGTGAGEFQFCKKNFLSIQTLCNIEDLKGQLLASLAESGFLPLTAEERHNLNRLRFSSGGRGGRRRQAFFDVPKRVNLHSETDVISQSVLAWSFYPRLLVRDGQSGGTGFRNISNNQTIRVHPTSVNRGRNELRWLSYYNIMQTKSQYNANETTAVEAFPIALLCGDTRCDMYSGVLVLDGNRARFMAPDWKTLLVIKVLRTRLREMLSRSFKAPGKMPTAQHQKWFDVWQRIFTQDFGLDSGNFAPAAGTIIVKNGGSNGGSVGNKAV